MNDKKSFEVIEEGRMLDDNGMVQITGGLICNETHIHGNCANNFVYCGPTSAVMYKNCNNNQKVICGGLHCNFYQI